MWHKGAADCLYLARKLRMPFTLVRWLSIPEDTKHTLFMLNMEISIEKSVQDIICVASSTMNLTSNKNIIETWYHIFMSL